MDINLRRVKMIEEMRAVADGGGSLECRVVDRAAVCELLEWVLGRFGYRRLPRADKGVVTCFLLEFTCLSEAQLDRRIGQFLETAGCATCPRRTAGARSSGCTSLVQRYMIVERAGADPHLLEGDSGNQYASSEDGNSRFHPDIPFQGPLAHWHVCPLGPAGRLPTTLRPRPGTQCQGGRFDGRLVHRNTHPCLIQISNSAPTMNAMIISRPWWLKCFRVKQTMFLVSSQVDAVLILPAA